MHDGNTVIDDSVASDILNTFFSSEFNTEVIDIYQIQSSFSQAI